MDLPRLLWITLFVLAPLLSIFGVPEIDICADVGDFEKRVAGEVIQRIKKAQQAGRPMVLGLSTGSAVIPVYEEIIRQYKEDDSIDLSGVITFNIDEFVGVPPTHPQSHYGFMFEQFFVPEIMYSEENRRGIKIENIHIPQGYVGRFGELSVDEQYLLKSYFRDLEEGDELDEGQEDFILRRRALAYSFEMEEKGPMDLLLLCLDNYGNIGFVDWGSGIGGGVGLTKLGMQTQTMNVWSSHGGTEVVPTEGLCMGMGNILGAKEIFVLAVGSKKAAAVELAVESEVMKEVPVTMLRSHPGTRFYIDEGAGGLLSAKRLGATRQEGRRR